MSAVADHSTSVTTTTEGALDAFAEQVGLEVATDSVTTVAGDLIAELLHRVHYEGVDAPETVLARAISFYLSERDAVEQGENPRDGAGIMGADDAQAFMDAVRQLLLPMCDR